MMSSNEWAIFSSAILCIPVAGRLLKFRARDVPGDGSCFFWSVIKSGILPQYENALDLRRDVCDYMRHDGYPMCLATYSLLAESRDAQASLLAESRDAQAPAGRLMSLRFQVK